MLKSLQEHSESSTPEMRLEELSREALIDLVKLYSKLYMALDGFWYLAVKERNSDDEALACDFWAWEKIARYEMKHLTAALKIQEKDVAAFMKAFQLVPWIWNMEQKVEIRGNDYALLTVPRCLTLEALEKEGEGREARICGLIEPKVFKDYASFFNPDIEVKCLKSPPRKSKDDVCCQWEFRLRK